MQLKVQDIIIDAMNLIGVIEISETPTAAEMQTGLKALNMMLDRWSAHRLMLRSTTSLTKTLTPGKYVYTVGTSTSDITSNKPLRIDSAFLRDTNGQDYPLEIMPKSAYEELQDKSYSQSIPAALFYDPGVAQQTEQEGALYLYPIPDSSMTYVLHLDYDDYMSEFSTLTAVITFEPAYYEALVYNLALRLYRRYHTDTARPVPEDIIALASVSMKTLENLNATQPRAAMDVPGKLSSFNIYTGDYS